MRTPIERLLALLLLVVLASTGLCGSSGDDGKY